MSNLDHNSGWQRRKVATQYDAKRFTSWTGWAFDVMEKRVIASLLARALGDMTEKRALDLPCGTGRIAELLVQKECRLTCGDISQEMINVAKQRLEPYSGYVESLEVLDVYDIDKPSASVDLVSCIRLFQHLDSDQRTRALKELARVSKRFVLVNVMYTSFYYGRLVNRRSYDLAHCWSGWPSGIVGFFHRARLPYIIGLRGSDVPGYNERLRVLDRLLFRHLSPLLWQRAAVVTAVSRHLKELAQQTTRRVEIRIVQGGGSGNATRVPEWSTETTG